MPRYLLQCEINPTKFAVLAAKRAEHYQFLIEHRSDIVFGGPARERPDSPPSTMIMVIDVDSLEAAHAFICAEPYNRHGGFSTVTIRPWSQVIPEATPGDLQRTLDTEHTGTRDCQT